MRFICIAVSVAILAGCASSPPQVSDFNGDSVKVTVHCGLGPDCYKPRLEDNAQADKTCAVRGRKAQFASTAIRTERTGNMDFNVADHLYICV